MGRRAILFGASLALVSAIALVLKIGRELQTHAPDLGSVLAFASVRDCRPGPQLEQLLGRLIAFDERSGEFKAGAPVAVPGFPEPLRPRLRREFGIGRDAMGFDSVAVLDLRGRWHGLNVVELRSFNGRRLEIRFSDSADRVRDTLVAAGFLLPAADQYRYPGLQAAYGARTMGIESHRSGGATLICE